MLAWFVSIRPMSTIISLARSMKSSLSLTQ